MQLSLIGLSLIIIGWLIQFFYQLKNKKGINPLFIIIYIIGVLVLVVDGYLSGLIELAVLNLISSIIAALVLIKLKK
jgi:uncharacterized protein with PQ loop repeat